MNTAATGTIDSWIAIWISVGAAVFALLSAVFAGWAVRQTWLYHPKPVLSHSFKRVYMGWGNEQRPALHFQIVNHGKGDANDLRMTVHNPVGDPVEVEEVFSLSHGQNADLTIGLVTGDMRATLDKM